MLLAKQQGSRECTIGHPNSHYIPLYRNNSNSHDYNMLQADVDTLSTWVTSNNLSLNITKCKPMVILRFRKKSVPVPHNNQPMESVPSYRYLGVTITEDLSWSTHVNEITILAYCIISSMCGQLVEYISQVWNPHLTKHVFNQLVQVRQFTLKVCLKQWNQNY